jgi:hypothetical protein
LQQHRTIKLGLRLFILVALTAGATRAPAAHRPDSAVINFGGLEHLIGDSIDISPIEAYC